MSRAKNDKEFLRTVKMTHTVYSILENGEFDMHEDNQYYKERTLSEVVGADKTRRFSSKFDDKKRKRELKETRSKGRAHNKSYKLPDNRFKKNGGNK